MTPTPLDRELCLGMLCDIHGTCKRYQDLDGNTDYTRPVRPTCPPTRDLYIPIEVAK